jgi:hypothetical protein
VESVSGEIVSLFFSGNLPEGTDYCYRNVSLSALKSNIDLHNSLVTACLKPLFGFCMRNLTNCFRS